MTFHTIRHKRRYIFVEDRFSYFFFKKIKFLRIIFKKKKKLIYKNKYMYKMNVQLSAFYDLFALSF